MPQRAQQETTGEIIKRFQQQAPVDVMGIAESLGLRVWEDDINPYSGKITRDPIHGDLPGEVAYFLALWRNVHRPPPPRLSHYTDAAGLCGIVRSGSLWATHIYYLNDSLEFKYGSQVINNIFTHEIDSSQGQITQRLRRLQECYQGHFAIWESLADPYVVCFCEAGNLLSQWRAYATNGSGFAIEFEPARLIQVLERDPEIRSEKRRVGKQG